MLQTYLHIKKSTSTAEYSDMNEYSSAGMLWVIYFRLDADRE